MEEMRSSIREIPVKEIRGNTVLALSVDSRELEGVRRRSGSTASPVRW